MYVKSDELKFLVIGVRNIENHIILNIINSLEYDKFIESVNCTSCINHILGKVIRINVKYIGDISSTKSIIIKKIKSYFNTTNISVLETTQMFI